MENAKGTNMHSCCSLVKVRDAFLIAARLVVGVVATAVGAAIVIILK